MRDKPQVLIVGSEKNVCERFRPVAADEDFSVHITESCELGRQLAGGEVYDLVIIDVRAAPEGALGLMEQVRQSDPETVVIVLSGDIPPEGLIDVAGKGAYEWVPEPFTEEQLMAAVHRGLDQRRLRVRVREFEALFESMTEGVFVVDKECRMVLWNRAGARLLGLDDRIRAGMRIEEALGQPALVGAVRRALAADMSSYVSISEEIETGLPGAPVLMAAITPFRDHRGGESGIVCSLREANTPRGQEQAKSQFVSMVTHELRAPLAAVEGYLTAYLTGAVGTDPKVNRQMLERARLRTHSLLDLVSDLLEYSRLDSRRVERKRELLNIGDVIVSTVELMKTQGESKELKFRTHIPDSLPLIEANRLEMEQLFTNLISNAIKYNVKKGWVEISVEECEDFVEVKIADTGIGIGKEDIPCIFDEFFRVSGPQTRYTTGTGLGLAIVKRIVDAHFGHIEVESEVDKGTTFTVRLPLGAGRHEETGHDGAETARVCG